MPVDKFGRHEHTNDTTTQMNDTFLRRDGQNTAIGTINMTGNTLTNVSNPVHDYDAANKIYVDENAGISKTGDTMSGNLILSADGDNDRILGCTNLNLERSFTIPLGSNTNRLYFKFLREPVVVYTDNGFLVKVDNENICQLGTVDDPPEIIMYKDVRMNSNHLTNLPIPTLPQEAATKLYVDETPRKIYQGYVPRLSGIIQNDKFGFVVTASSYLNNGFRPMFAFNGVYKPRGNGGRWATNGETRNFWIQIECPDSVRLWRISLRGADGDNQRISKWILRGSNDGNIFTDLYETLNDTFIDTQIRYFEIETTEKFNIFRLFCLEAEGRNPGLSHMQLYIYSD